jgi:hypothetical protein
MRLSPLSGLSYREWRDYILHLPLEYKDYNNFVEKYGSFISGKPAPEAVIRICSYFEIVGILLKRKLLSTDIVWDFYGMYTTMMAKLLMPLIEGFREEYNVREFEHGEYLFNEMKKREQQLAKI